MKIVIVILLLFYACSAKAQTLTPTPGTAPRANSSFVPEDYNLSVRANFYMPRFLDTTQANTYTKFDTCGRIIFTYDVSKTWVRKCSPKRWEETGKNLGNSNLIQSDLNRTFDLNGGKLEFINTGRLVISTTDPFPSDNTKLRVYSDNYAQSGLMVTNNRSFGASSIYGFVWLNDTITNANLGSRKDAAFIAQRAFYPASGTAFNNFFNANEIQNVFYLPDSIRFRTWGGDFNSNRIGQFYLKHAGYTGRSVIGNVSETSVFEAQSGALFLSLFSGSFGNSIRGRGWFNDGTAYLLLNPTDTVDKHHSFMTGGNIAGYVGKQVDMGMYASGAPSVDSAYGMLAPFAKTRHYIGGTMAFGGTIESTEGIGRPAHASSVLDIWNTTKGVLLPRMSGSSMNAIASPATGLLIYNTDSLAFCYYNGTAWVKVGSGSSSASQRFAVSGEDEEATQNRTFDLDGFDFLLINGGDIRLEADNDAGDGEFSIIADSVRINIIGRRTDTTDNYKVLLRNEVSGALQYINWLDLASGLGSLTWNSIASPTGDQSLTYDPGEISTWTSSNTTEDLLTVNTSTLTTASLFSLNSTSTALNTGNNLAEFVMSGANAGSAVTATGIRISVTNSGTTSQNIALRATASGAASANYAGYFDNRVSVGAADIVGGASSSHTLMVRSLDNTNGNGIIVYPNANYGTSTSYGFAGLSASADYTMSIIGADLMLNSAQIFIAGTTDPTAKLHIAAGSTAAGTAPIKLTSGTSMTTAEAGAIEFTTDDLFLTITTGAARKRVVMADPVGGLTSGQVAYSTTNGRLTGSANVLITGGGFLQLGASGSAIGGIFSNTAVLDFPSTSASSYSDLTITVTGAALGDAVFIGAPNGSVVNNTAYTAWVSATNTVTVRLINNDAVSAADPASGTFRASVVVF